MAHFKYYINNKVSNKFINTYIDTPTSKKVQSWKKSIVLYLTK